MKAMTTDKVRLLTQTQVAEEVGVPVRRVRGAVRHGHLRAVDPLDTGRKNRRPQNLIRPADIPVWLDRYAHDIPRDDSADSADVTNEDIARMRLLTKAQVAASLNLSIDSIEALTRRGELPSKKYGRRVLYKVADVDLFVARLPVAAR
jgi:excisionase family DNA binding protein